MKSNPFARVKAMKGGTTQGRMAQMKGMKKPAGKSKMPMMKSGGMVKGKKCD